nr:hypothetical protein [Alloscardovia omnicolens]
MNSWRYENGEPRAHIDTRKIILFVVDGICALLLAAWAVMALLKFRKRWTAETSAQSGADATGDATAANN